MLTDAEAVKFVAFKAGLGAASVCLQECLAYLPEKNLIVSVGGDLLSPYPLSTLDKGLGMVVPWHCRWQGIMIRNSSSPKQESDFGLCNWQSGFAWSSLFGME